MSTNAQDFQLLQQWFWPTNPVLSPIMDTSNNPNSSAISTITTTVASTTSTFHRRHRHWWKVCWIYNNGNLVYHGLNKQSNTKQYHQQWHQQQEQQSLPSLASLVNDRCVNNKDDQLFSMAKQNMSINSEDMNLSTDMQKLSTNATNNSSQICSSHTSLFLQQKLAQPFTALLKQKAEHKNSITQFFIDYKGAEWRAEQLRFQMPTHDIQMLKQTSTEIKFVRNQQRKAQIKPQLFFNKSSNICCKCKKQLEIGSYGVKISIQLNGNTNCGFGINTDDEDNSGKLTNSNSEYINQSLNCSTVLYHVDCFTCFECCQVLVDFKAFLYHNNSDSSVDPSKLNRLYCCRHFVELYKPRCQYCDHLIFEEECTEAEGKVWHIGHFCCTECKRSLGGQQYIMADPNHHNDNRKCDNRDKSDNISDRDKQLSDKKVKSQQLPYCLTCFDILFGELCEECGELIGCDVGAISHEGRSWHASNTCFKCNMCSKSLLGKPFLPALDGKIYCSIVCSQEAIKRNRYREKKKQIKDQSINSVLSKHEMSYKQSNHLNADTVKDGLLTPIAQISSNCEFTKIITQQNNLLQNNQQIKVNLNNNNNNLKLNESDNSATNSEKSAESSGVSVINNSLNQINEQTLHQYINQYQPHSKAPNYILEYLKQQLQQNGCAHHIIGATLEYGSSVSEDERTNQVHAQQTANGSTHHSDQITSSSSSSRNATPLEINNSISNNAIKYPHLTPYSSSSNETTPLLMRPYSSNAKPLDYRLNSSSQNSTLLTNSINSSKLLLEPLSMNPEDKVTPQSYDQSSNSSCAEHSNKANTCVENENKMTPSDTPSTQSTALQSTSSQTTPETNPRSVSKSVSFDPNVKETSSKKVNRKNSYQKSRTNRNKERNYCGDNHSCSTCSTCSSSSSSDDNFDYQSVLDKSKNQWYGGTKIQYVTNERKKKINGKTMQQTVENNDSCTLS